MTIQTKNKVVSSSGELLWSQQIKGADGDNELAAVELRAYADAQGVSGAVAGRFEVWTATTAGVMTRAFRVDSAQITTLGSGGQAGQTGKSIFSNVPIGSVAYASMGTSTSAVAGTVYCTEIFIPRNVTLTGIKYLTGAEVGEGSAIAALYNNSGTLLANSALGGLAITGADAFLDLPFTATYSATGPAMYWASISHSADGPLRLLAASTFVDVFTTSATGVFGTLAAITPTTAFSALKGPILYAY